MKRGYIFSQHTFIENLLPVGHSSMCWRHRPQSLPCRNPNAYLTLDMSERQRWSPGSRLPNSRSLPTRWLFLECCSLYLCTVILLYIPAHCPLHRDSFFELQTRSDPILQASQVYGFSPRLWWNIRLWVFDSTLDYASGSQGFICQFTTIP